MMRAFFPVAVASSLILAIPATVAAAQTPAPPAQVASASRAAQTQSQTHVYLLRGLANIFSLGLDDLSEKLERRGVRTSVHNHAEYEDIAGAIINRWRGGWRGPVVLIGHSLGADNVYPLAAILARQNIPVSLIVSFDPVNPQVVPANVSRAVNYYLSGCCYAVERSKGFKGSLANYDLEGRAEVGHLNIEKSPRLHADVIARIVGGASATPRPRAASAPPRPAETASPAATAATDATGSTSAPAAATPAAAAPTAAAASPAAPTAAAATPAPAAAQ